MGDLKHLKGNDIKNWSLLPKDMIDEIKDIFLEIKDIGYDYDINIIHDRIDNLLEFHMITIFKPIGKQINLNDVRDVLGRISDYVRDLGWEVIYDWRAFMTNNYCIKVYFKKSS